MPIGSTLLITARHQESVGNAQDRVDRFTGAFLGCQSPTIVKFRGWVLMFPMKNRVSLSSPQYSSSFDTTSRAATRWVRLEWVRSYRSQRSRECSRRRETPETPGHSDAWE